MLSAGGLGQFCTYTYFIEWEAQTHRRIEMSSKMTMGDHKRPNTVSFSVNFRLWSAMTGGPHCEGESLASYVVSWLAQGWWRVAGF